MNDDGKNHKEHPSDSHLVDPDSATQTDTIREGSDSGSRSRAGRVIPPIADYELINCIGWGAYGEVWLAKNIMGTCRAVKIIHREAFDNERPYEREFAGIQKFEPISRNHESQVDILHIGRNNELGCFYYVMELADDADSGGEINPANYAPRTLKVDLNRRGRLPISECIDICIALTTALENLHAHGLIHRDIKPANIIFIEGQPKLADIGLVAEADKTMSYVGTAGYLPPEGPGSVQADLFSLGKVMYEMATGRDRMDFPQMPTEIDAITDGSKLFEFNEILVRACHQDLRKRYATAAELREELELLRGGKSVRTKRSRERLLAVCKKVAASVLIIGILVVGGLQLAKNPDSTPALEARPLRIDYPEVFLWGNLLAFRSFDWEPNQNRFVFAGTGELHIWEGETSVVRALEVENLGEWKIFANGFPKWNPEGSRFAVQATRKIGGTEEGPERICRMFIIDPETGNAAPVGESYPAEEDIREYQWTPDAKSLTCYDRAGRMFSLSLNGARAVWLNSNIPNERGINLCSYSPDGKWLAITADGGSKDDGGGTDIWLMPHLGGRAVPVTDQPGFDGFADWSPEGDRIYFLSAGGVFQKHTRGLWELDIDPQTGAVAGKPRKRLVRQNQIFWGLKVSADGHRITYGVREPNSRIWCSPANAPDKAMVITRGNSSKLSNDGKTVFFVGETTEQVGIYQIDAEGKTLARQISNQTPMGGYSLAPTDTHVSYVANDGERTGIFVVNIETGKVRLVDEFREWNSVKPVWSPDGRWIAYTKDKNLYRVPVTGGEPEIIATLYRWQGWSVRWSPDGNHLAALAYASPAEWDNSVGVFVIKIADGSVIKVTPDSEDRYKEGLAWHPDGKRLSYFFYGPEDYSAKIKLAYLDGSPTTELIDQEEHWDYVGVWSPDGRQYYFHSDDCEDNGKSIHVLDMESGGIQHAVRAGGLPRWSGDGRRMAWGREGAERIRYLEVIDEFL